MDWTIGPLDTFLDRFFLGPFYWERGGGGTPLIHREFWDAVHQYLRGAVGRLLFLREGWKTNYWYSRRGGRWLYRKILLIDGVLTESYKSFWAIFRLTVRIFELGCYAGLFFRHASAKLPPKHWTSAGAHYLSKIWPILVFDPPLLSHSCTF